MKTYYLSAYALSSGSIEKVEAHERDDNFVFPQGRFKCYRLGVQIHYSEADAATAAEFARIKKIKSLKAQIAKLEKMKFGGTAP